MPFEGFPRKVRSIPVPSPLFGPLLEEIDDFAELKCTLRVIWLLNQKKGYPRYVSLGELLADRTLARSLSAVNGGVDHEQVQRSVERAVERGTLIACTAERHGEQLRLYMLNTESDRNALARLGGKPELAESTPGPEPWDGAAEHPNIFALYEDNVGTLTPMIAEELREAEQIYPGAWIEDGIREAVRQNKRSWRYIARILERWEQEGRNDGKPGGYPKKTGYY